MIFKVQPPVGRGSKSVVVGGDGMRARSLLGNLAEVGPKRSVWLDQDREHVVAIVGKRGSGKTHTLGVLVEGLAQMNASADDGDRNAAARRAVAVFDTLNLFQWIDLPLATARGPDAQRQRDLLQKWGLQAEELVPTFWHLAGSEPATPKSHAFSIRPADLDAQDWGRLLGLDILADPMGQLVGEIHAKVQKRVNPSGGRGNGSYRVDDMLEVLRSDASIQADFASETIRGVRQRLSAYSRSGLFNADHPDWRSALTPGAVAVFLLGRVPEDVRSVLVFLVIRRLLESRSAASEASKHAAITGASAPTDHIPPTWLVIDEAQNILPSRNSTAANDILTRYVREGRNFGLSLAITTQQPNSIDSRIMAQVDTLFVHTLTVRTDVNYILANLKSAEPDSIQLGLKSLTLAESIRLLQAGQCLISSVDTSRLVYCEVRPRLTLHGGFEG